ncbi:MAG: N-glycosylase/DNA lyase, partial [Candidatus Micrarchaeota archaeon]|nr:N-glycosylase/DNA lyase [Candidatus Micrarchaeota archaeon]
MKALLKEIEALKRSAVRKTVEKRISEFKRKGKSGINEIFSELCFCLLTANFNAERAMRIQDEIGDGFIISSENELAKRLRELGHRFPNARASYIADAAKRKGEILSAIKEMEPFELRDYLARSVKGLGYKEASHFLRNIGYDDFAIIDFHIIDVLVKYGLLLKRPKSLAKSRYLEIEQVLAELAKKTGLTQS